MSESLRNLPADLLPEILEQITVEDVLNLKKSIEKSPKYKVVEQQCDDRLSVVTYLNKKFGNGNAWLEALSDSCGYISGSTSLDFFVPGSTTLFSDCDVYVSDYDHMDCFLRHGDELNIKWMDNADMVKVQLASGKRTIRMNVKEFRKIHTSGRLYKVLEGEYQPKYSRIPDYWLSSVELEFGEGYVSARHIHDDTWYGTQGILDVKYGEIYKGNAVIPVQVILQSDRDRIPFASIFKFHSTCVQSFIGPYTACHLYGKEAAKKRSHCWIDNVKKYVPNMRFPSRPTPTPLGSIGHLAPEWKKYEDRGFSYFSLAVCFGYQRRQIGDDQCTIIDYEGYAGSPISLSRGYQDEVRLIKWNHYNNARPSLSFNNEAETSQKQFPNDFMSSIQRLAL